MVSHVEQLTRLLQHIRRATNLLGQLLAAVELLHQATTDIVLAVPLDLLGRSRVEHEADGELYISPVFCLPLSSLLLFPSTALTSSSTSLHSSVKPTYLVVLPHLARNIIPVLQFIHKPTTRIVQQQPTHTAERFRSEELDLCIGLLGVDETCRVHLDLFHVDAFGADRHGHLVAVACAVVAVGRGL